MLQSAKRLVPRPLRKPLRKVRSTSKHALDRWFGPKAAAGSSWYIDKNRGIAEQSGSSLMAWMNYHHREICGKQSFWLGHRVIKNPMDAWIYQEIIFDVKPDVIIEFGNKNGGSALYLAGICELIGHGKVLAVDIDHEQFTAPHPRIELVTGDCGSKEIIDEVTSRCAGQKVLIIHDADHSKEAVLRDMRNYAGLVDPGSYLIVEDSIHGVPGFSSDPHNEKIGSFLMPETNTALQGIEQFIQENSDFEVDESRERYILTYNYRGFLRRKEA